MKRNEDLDLMMNLSLFSINVISSVNILTTIKNDLLDRCSVTEIQESLARLIKALSWKVQ